MRATFRNFFDVLNVAAFFRDRHDHAVSVTRWTLILVPMAVSVGTLCAAFLWSLDAATQARFDHRWLLFLLPLGGAGIALLYLLTGRSVEAGNNLIVEQIHEPDGGVPLRMAPLVFLGTIVTHLLGGSAGREGTAVQLGGSLASATGKLFRLDLSGVRILLMAGVAAGFGAVFGTPLAGAIFALEVLAIGRVEYAALVPCLVAALVGDWTCRAWGIHHTPYHIGYVADASASLLQAPLLLIKAAIAGVAFGLAGLIFAEATLLVQKQRKLIELMPWMPPPVALLPMTAGALDRSDFSRSGTCLRRPGSCIDLITDRIGDTAVGEFCCYRHILRRRGGAGEDNLSGGYDVGEWTVASQPVLVLTAYER